MTSMIHLAVLFAAKMLDNALGTAKTILVQRNRCFLAGIALILSNYIYFCITKNIVTADSDLAILVVSVAKTRFVKVPFCKSYKLFNKICMRDTGGALDALCKYRKRRQEHLFLPPRSLSKNPCFLERKTGVLV